MSKDILREKLQKIVESIDTIEPVADFDSDQWEIGNANIKRTDGAIGSLNVNIKSNEYGVGIDGKNKGDILDYLKDNFDLNNENEQNKRYKVMPEKIEEVVRRYAGVKKENMEQEFREYLQKYTTLVDGTINIYASALMLGNDVYEAVRNRIEFKNFYEINSIDLFLEQYELIQNIIPNQNNTNDNGHDNGNLSGALGKYRLFLQYLEVVKQMDLYDENPDKFFVNANVHWYFKVNGKDNKYPVKAICKDIADKLEILMNGGGFNTSAAKAQLKNIFSKNMEFYDSNAQGNGNMVDEKLQEKIDLLEHKKQIILQGSPGTGKTRLAKQIAKRIILQNAKQLILGLKVDDEIKFSDGHTATILDVSNTNISVSGRGDSTYKLDVNSIFNIIENNQYKFDKYVDNSTLYFEMGVAGYVAGYMAGYAKLIQFHPAYSYEDFVRGIVATTDENGNISYEVKNKVLAEMAENAFNNPDEKFVLIIDEINRANLAAVLGELIYALEYRGEAVESMYAIDGDRKITLPENLYIIGTMNTADRSVGHIDYAIRRRFAFVDVKTDRKVIEEEYPDNLALFKKIEPLFNEHLSDEFAKDDVMIGHSYFLNDDLEIALKYEIKPILYEYVKDGVLIDKGGIKISDEVKELTTDINTL